MKSVWRNKLKRKANGKAITSMALVFSLVLSGLLPMSSISVYAEESTEEVALAEEAALVEGADLTEGTLEELSEALFDEIMTQALDESEEELVEEVAPVNETVVAPVAEENRGNLASGIIPSYSSPASTTYNVNRPVHATDGIINDRNNYSDPGSTTGGPQWMQVDLGAVYKIGEVDLFRYWHDNRTYNDTVVMISTDPNFAVENSYILWNANRDASRQWPNGNGQSGTHTLPTGTDEDYVETSSGLILSVNREDGANYFEAQYVRVYMNGNNKNECNHVVELQVYAREESQIIEPKEKFVTPENIEVSGENIALHKEAKYSAPASTSYNVNRPIQATDGIINDRNNYADPGGNAGGAHWMEIDLKDDYDIQFVKLYRYWRDNRVYNDTVILVSSEEDFAADKTIVLWNANREEKTWTEDDFAMPKGSQKNYIETENGLALAVNSELTTWLDGQDRDIPETGFAGRYVRVYMNGNFSVDSNNDVTEERVQNHVVELEVYGTEHSDSFIPSSKVDDRWNFKTKETPLVDLAKYVTYDGNNYTLSDESAELTRPENLTDGDKYYINNISNNKDPYVESGRGAVAPEGTEWVQLDLGRSYPIEVINLKRKIYKEGHTSSNGKGRNANDLINYDKTIILASENEDMSDAYVVHYNAPANDTTVLPEGVEKPAGATTTTYQETMGGDWYYMDNTNNNGKGYTKIGTVKNARYIRIYSSDNVSEGETLMNLSVYGYKNESDVQEYSKRRVIDNAHPMFFEAAYCSDIYTTYQKDPAQLQGWNTIAGRWNTIDDDLKDYTVLSMHLNNLYPYSNHNVGQSGLQDYYENCLQQAYEVGEKGIPTALMLINASDVPNVSETAPGSAVDYNPTKDVDMQWVDLMFRMYPNMQGVFSTESFWSGAHGEVAEATAKMLRIADSHGGFLLWSEANHNNIINNVSGNANYRKAIEDCGQSLFATYKNTRGSQDSNATLSMIMGNWLAGYTGGFGILSDTWAWGNSGNGDIYKTHNFGGKPWTTNVCMPDAILGMQMLSAYLEGGTVYTFEWESVIGTNDTKAPSYDHVIEEVLKYIVKNPAPTRKEVLDRTKFMVYNEPSGAIYENTVGPNNVMSLYSTSRYGAIPCVSTGFGSKDAIIAKMQLTAANEGSACPTLVDNNDPRLSDEEFMKKLYPITYVGDAFADKYNDTWFFYNSSINTDVKQTATVPLEVNETARFTTVIDPHAFLRMTESDNGQKININLNNYRVNRNKTIFNQTEEFRRFNLNWSGSSATGQGVSPGKRSVYVFQTYMNVVNAQTIKQVHTTANRADGVDIDLDKDGRPDEFITQYSPQDNDLRETVFKIDSLTKKPTVKVVNGQQPDTDGIAQYEDPKVEYNPTTQTATISINTNGYVDLEITDLDYVVNENAVKIEDGVKKADPPSINVALNKKVTSNVAEVTANPLARVTDGDVSSAAKFAELCNSKAGGDCYIQIDLGEKYNIYNVELFRYWADSRKYFNTVIMLSNDVNFAAGSTRVIWNANTAASGKNGQALTSGDWSKVPTDGNDPLYSETSKGKKFYVNNEDHAEVFEARYVRIYNNGSTSNGSSHFVEVRVNAEGTPEVQTRNLAQGKAITASANPSTTSGNRPLSWAVDGQLNLNNYTDPGATNNPKGGPVYVDIDLGKTQEIYNVELWRYWNDARQYKDTVVMVSNDANFAPAETYVLWNAAAAGVWNNIQAGKDPLYNETQEGKKFAVNGVNAYWLDGREEKPGDSIEARYVRVMNNGNNINKESHFVEIKVNGIASLTDETAPTKVTDLNLKAFTNRTASIGYTPALDDTGVKTYEVHYKKVGSANDSVVETVSSRVLLTNLEAATAYEVTVYAVDYENNRSEVSDVFTFTTAS